MGRHAKIKVKQVEAIFRRRLSDWVAFQRIPEFLYDNLTYPWLPVGLEVRWLDIPFLDEQFLALTHGKVRQHAFHVEIDPRTHPTLEQIWDGDVKTVLKDWDKVQRDERQRVMPPDMGIEARCKSFVLYKWLDYALHMDAETDLLAELGDPFDWDVSPEERAERLAIADKSRKDAEEIAPKLERPLPATSGDVRAFIMAQTNADSNSQASLMPQKLIKGGWVERIDHPTDARSYYLVPKTSEKEDVAKFLVPGKSDRVEKNYLHAQAVEALEIELLTQAQLAVLNSSEYANDNFLDQAFGRGSFPKGSGEGLLGVLGDTVEEMLTDVGDAVKDAVNDLLGDSIYEKENIFIDYVKKAVDELMASPETLPSMKQIERQSNEYKIVPYDD